VRKGFNVQPKVLNFSVVTSSISGPSFPILNISTVLALYSSFYKYRRILPMLSMNFEL